MTRSELLTLHDSLTQQAREIMVRKNQDYAGESDPFRNFLFAEHLGVSPIKGLLLRVGDKLSRIRSFDESGNLENESVDDAILDIVNYMVLAAGLVREGSRARGRETGSEGLPPLSECSEVAGSVLTGQLTASTADLDVEDCLSR